MSVLTRSRIRFGPFELDPQSGELFKLGYKLNLHGQPIEVLSILLERPGEVVTRKDLCHRLWPHVVDFEHSLNSAIKKLRQFARRPRRSALRRNSAKKGLLPEIKSKRLNILPSGRCKFILTVEGEIRCNVSSDASGLPASSH